MGENMIPLNEVDNEKYRMMYVIYYDGRLLSDVFGNLPLSSTYADAYPDSKKMKEQCGKDFDIRKVSILPYLIPRTLEIAEQDDEDGGLEDIAEINNMMQDGSDGDVGVLHKSEFAEIANDDSSDLIVLSLTDVLTYCDDSGLDTLDKLVTKVSDGREKDNKFPLPFYSVVQITCDGLPN